MANTQKGKFSIFIYLLLILACCRILVASSSVLAQQQEELHDAPYDQPETETGTVSETRIELNQQGIALHKLEELVRKLSDIVAKLEPVLSASQKEAPLEVKRNQAQDMSSPGKWDGERLADFDGEERSEGRTRDVERARVVSVTKYSPFWSERFQFVSAVKLDSDVTCTNVLPFRDYEGLSKYVAVGDDQGRVYVFSRNGDVVVEFYTICNSPITVMLSYLSVYKNESVLVTGHQNGVVLMHKVCEGSNGEDWNSLSMENVAKFLPSENGEEGSAVTILEVHHVGRSRYILSSDDRGKIRVLKENGSVHGSVMLSSKPLAFLKQRLLFLTESGAGSLDLRSMKLKESECEGLNHSLARNYVFDAAERSKAYGFTSEGDLIHVLLLGDIMNFKCRVRSKKKLDMNEPLAFQAIKGYLLVVNEEKVFVYNVSTHHYVRLGGPRYLFSAGLDEIRSSFLSYQVIDARADGRVIPLIASDHEKLIVLGLGTGCVGMYRSRLPVFKGEFSTMLWTSPVLLFILFLFAAWFFFAKKKEALTSWGPDDPFTSSSASTGAPFTDSSSRSSEIMDLRGGGGLRATSRYGSPSRYPGGVPGSFRPSPTDANSRSTSVDPNYRAPSEIKYRGPTLESTGFPTRRENLFVNNQVGDDST